VTDTLKLAFAASERRAASRRTRLHCTEPFGADGNRRGLRPAADPGEPGAPLPDSP